MITGKTKLIGILGWPVEHSLSPVMHNAAFHAAGLEYAYVPLPVKPACLSEAVAGLKALGFAGANVTIPHKVAVMSFLDRIDISAQLVGAVNTIVLREGAAIGYNTDADGFIASLLAEGVEVDGKKVVILGAGGAARAVLSGFLTHHAFAVMVAARDIGKAATLIGQFSSGDNLTSCDWSEKELPPFLADCDIVVNCTPIGMSPHIDDEPPFPWEALNKAAVVCDLIYNPPRTRFLQSAIGRGHKVINGEGMLIEQGALAFFLWTGQDPQRQALQVIFEKKSEIR